MNQLVSSTKAWAEIVGSLFAESVQRMPFYGFCFAAMMAFCLASWIALRKPVSGLGVRFVFPLLAMGSYGVYELTNPPEWNIRIDLFLISVVLLPTVVLTINRLRNVAKSKTEISDQLSSGTSR